MSSTNAIMKVYLESNGCIRRNSEIVKLKTYFNANHVKILNRPKKADYIILSTCALKEEDEDHSISRIRFLNKFGGKLLVLGCLPDIAPSRFSEFTGTSSIPPREIEKIDTYFTGNKIKFSEIENTNTIPKKISVSSFTTALQKLKQDFEFSTAFRLRILRYLDKTIQVLLRKNAHNFYLSISR
jgi:tRNA A37 methylthiotransferase MiaB